MFDSKKIHTATDTQFIRAVLTPFGTHHNTILQEIDSNIFMKLRNLLNSMV